MKCNWIWSSWFRIVRKTNTNLKEFFRKQLTSAQFKEWDSCDESSVVQNNYYLSSVSPANWLFSFYSYYSSSRVRTTSGYRQSSRSAWILAPKLQSQQTLSWITGTAVGRSGDAYPLEYSTMRRVKETQSWSSCSHLCSLRGRWSCGVRTTTWPPSRTSEESLSHSACASSNTRSTCRTGALSCVHVIRSDQ